MPDETRPQPAPTAPASDSTSSFAPGSGTTSGASRTTGTPGSQSGSHPTNIPGYEILGELGRGGMGVVYQARQVALNRVVAVKMIRGAAGASVGEVSRFLAEAEAVAAIRHPNVVQVFESGTHEGMPYMALEFLPGGALSGRLRNHPLAPGASADLVARVADGVHAAHAQGIVHRDLKPANVLLDADGNPKVTDFGIARRGASDLTATGAVVGTPSYMAPEQAAGRAKYVGPAADIYALGVILFECMTGTVPFTGPDSWSVIRRVLTDAPPRPRKIAPGVPRDLELICLKCLEKEPHLRYATAADLADDLRRYLAGKAVTARPLGAASRAWRAVKRNPVVSGAVVAVLLSSTAGTAVAWVKADEASASAATARAEEEKARAALAAQLAAETLKDAANREKDAAVAKELAAEALRARTAETVVYARELQSAFDRLAAGDVPATEQALRECKPEQRNWEWRLADRWLARTAGPLPRPAGPHTPDRLAVSPDGRWLASAGQERDPLGPMVSGLGFVWLWDLKAGTPPAKLPGRFNGVDAVVFDPDGRRLAAFGDVVRLWDLSEPSKAAWESDPLPSYGTLGVRFTPTGLIAVRAASGGPEPVRVLTWRHDGKGFAKPTEVRITFPDATCAAVAPDGDAILLAGNPQPAPPDGTPVRSSARLFHPDGKAAGEPVAFAGHAAAAAFTADGSGVAVAAQADLRVVDTEASLVLIRWDDRKPGTRIRLGNGEVRRLEFRPDRRAVAVSGTTASTADVWVWNPDSGEVATTARFDLCGSVGLFRDGRLAVGDYKTGVRIWNPTELFDRVFGGKPDPLAAFALLPNDRLATVPTPVRDGSKPALVRVQNLSGGPFEAFVPDPGIEIMALARAGDRLAVSVGASFGNPCPVVLSDPTSKQTLRRWLPPGDMRAWALASDPAGGKVAFGGVRPAAGDPADAGVKLYDVSTGELSQNLPLPDANQFPTRLAFAPDGSRLAAVLDRPYGVVPGQKAERPAGEVVVWDVATGALAWRSGPIRHGSGAVAYSPDGSLLAASGGDGRVRVWNADGTPKEREFPVPSRTAVSQLVDSLAFSPDGRRLVGTGERALHVWDVATGQPVATIPLVPGVRTHFGPRSVAFTPEGGRLVVCDGEGRVLVFDAGPPTGR